MYSNNREQHRRSSYYPNFFLSLPVPRLLPALSIALSAASAVASALLVRYPTSRTMPGLLTGVILPFVSWWLATIPVTSAQLITMRGLMDPVSPFMLDPFLRPFLSDPFFRDMWQLLPRPLLFTAPTTVRILSFFSSCV